MSDETDEMERQDEAGALNSWDCRCVHGVDTEEEACPQCEPTPDDKPKLPACPCGKCHCVICGNQMDRDAALVAAEKRIEELATELGRAENEAKRVYGAEIDKLEEQLTAAQDLLTGDGRKLMQMLGTAQAERDELQSKIDETIDIHVIGRLRAQAEALAGAITGCVTELEDVLHNTNKGQVHFDGDDFHERLGAARKALAEYRSDK